MASDKQPRWRPSEIFYKSMELAGTGHEGDTRKGSDIPYLGHLLGVASLVIEAGGTQEQAAGALLHDLLEDTEMTYAELAEQVGAPIAEIVMGCTDTMHEQKEEFKKLQGDWSAEQKAKHWWEVRKLPYVISLVKKTCDFPSLLVTLADKTYNAENTAADLRGLNALERDKVWSKFNVGYEYQKQWYEGLRWAFTTTNKKYPDEQQALLQRFVAAVDEMFPKEEGK